MRIAVVGTGAIGATFAAALECAGHDDLVLCARSPREPPAVERDGEPLQALRAPVLADPALAGGRAEWVLLAAKAHQTAGAAPWLAVLAGPGSIVVALQNGVEHRELVARRPARSGSCRRTTAGCRATSAPRCSSTPRPSAPSSGRRATASSPAWPRDTGSRRP